MISMVLLPTSRPNSNYKSRPRLTENEMEEIREAFNSFDSGKDLEETNPRDQPGIKVIV